MEAPREVPLPEVGIIERIKNAVDVLGAFDNCFFHSYAAYLLTNNLPLPDDLFTPDPQNSDSPGEQLKKNFKEPEDLKVFSDYHKIKHSNAPPSEMLLEKTMVLGVLFREWFAKQLSENKNHKAQLLKNMIHLSHDPGMGVMFQDDKYKPMYEANKIFFDSLMGDNSLNAINEQLFRKYWDQTGYTNYCRYLAKPHVKVSFTDVEPVLIAQQAPYVLYSKPGGSVTSQHEATTGKPIFELVLSAGEGHYSLLQNSQNASALDAYTVSMKQYNDEKTKVLLLDTEAAKRLACNSMSSLLLKAVLPAGQINNLPINELIHCADEIKSKILSAIPPTPITAAPVSELGLIEIQADLTKFPEKVQGSNDTRIAIGDLHGNTLKLIYILIEQGVLTLEKGATDYDALRAIYLNNSLENEDITRFQSIIDNVTVNKDRPVTLIGDELADRGQNDYFTLYLLNKLKKKDASVDIMYSNHGIEFIRDSEKDQFTGEHGLLIDLYQNQGQSLSNMIFLINKKLITQEEVRELTQNGYRTMVKAIGYSISDDGQLTLYTHAPVGLETLKAIADSLRTKYNDSTTDTLIQSINEINEKINEKKDLADLFSSKPTVNLNNPIPLDKPFYRLIWNRVLGSELKTKTSKGLEINFVHGHIGANPLSNLRHSNIDNDLGKYTDALATTLGLQPEYDKKPYKIVRSKVKNELAVSEVAHSTPLPLPLAASPVATTTTNQVNTSLPDASQQLTRPSSPPPTPPQDTTHDQGNVNPPLPDVPITSTVTMAPINHSVAGNATAPVSRNIATEGNVDNNTIISVDEAETTTEVPITDTPLHPARADNVVSFQNDDSSLSDDDSAIVQLPANTPILIAAAETFKPKDNQNHSNFVYNLEMEITAITRAQRDELFANVAPTSAQSATEATQNDAHSFHFARALESNEVRCFTLIPSTKDSTLSLGAFIYDPISENSVTTKDDPGKYQIAEFPKIKPAVSAPTDSDRKNLERAKVEFAVKMAMQLIAGKTPSNENPITLTGTNKEELRYLWTALVMLGEKLPKEMRFDKSAIQVNSSKFSPDEEKGRFAFFSKSLYKTVFKDSPGPIQQAVKDAERLLSAAKVENPKQKPGGKSSRHLYESYKIRYKNELAQPLSPPLETRQETEPKSTPVTRKTP